MENDLERENTMNEFVELMTKRRSVRKFQSKMITNAELDQVLYAGLFAASGLGRQPCYFIAVRDPETRNLLSSMNARILGQPSIDPFYGAPVVVVVLADTTSPTYLYDGSLALGNMMNAAHAVGLGSCWIHRAKEEFETQTGKMLLKEWGLPETVEGIGHLILGYPAEEELPEAAPRKEDHVVFLMEKKHTVSNKHAFRLFILCPGHQPDLCHSHPLKSGDHPLPGRHGTCRNRKRGDIGSMVRSR